MYQKRTLVKSAESSELAQEADNQEEINLGLIPAIYNSLKGRLNAFSLVTLCSEMVYNKQPSKSLYV